jgi:DNA (cytosine-5)-methyltransferase 1
MKKYSLLSLFTGAGALDYAFESSGHFETKIAIEVQKEFCETLRGNKSLGLFRNADIFEADINEIDPVNLCKRNKVAFKPDGIIGGPPCESFTILGKKMGRKDPRGKLVFNYANWVCSIRPKFFLMENVPDLIKIERGTIFSELLDQFASNGYTVYHEILKAADYGGATIRRRLFMVGFYNNISFEFPKPTNIESIEGSGDLKPYKTVREALEGLPEPSLKNPGVPIGHVRINHTKKVIDRFKTIPEGGYDYIRKRSRLSLDKPCPSLMAGNLNGIRSHIHPIEPRELTNRESARIQGFPDDYYFFGNHAAIGKQIANAIPICFGKALSSQIYKALNREKV